MKSHVFMQLLGQLDNFYQWLTIINTDIFFKEGKVVDLFFKGRLDFYCSSFLGSRPLLVIHHSGISSDAALFYFMRL